VWIPFVLGARPTYFRRKIRESDVSEHLFPCLTYPLDRECAIRQLESPTMLHSSYITEIARLQPFEVGSHHFGYQLFERDFVLPPKL
jgi:hypothetical protein